MWSILTGFSVREIGPAEQFRADAVGPIGHRVFYLSIVASGIPLWFVAEKQQVAAFAELGRHMLEAAGVDADEDAVLQIEQRLAESAELGDAEFRIGDLRLGLSENDLVSIILESVEEDDEAVNFVIAPEQLQAAAAHALRVVADGRPLCPRCGEPIDPGEYHRCPAVDPHLN